MNQTVKREKTDQDSIDSMASKRSLEEDKYWRTVMNICQQQNPIPFGLQYPSWEYRQLEPIDCGSYSQVIKGFDQKTNKTVVFKVINVVTDRTVQRLEGIRFGGTEMFSDVYNEINIAKSLSNLHLTTCDLRGHEYQTHNYPKLLNVKLVSGKVPNYFLFRSTDDRTEKIKSLDSFSEPNITPKQYLVLMMKFCGQSLWRCIRNKTLNANQLMSICLQITYALTIGECVYQFEHRDLHINNVLIKNTKKSHLSFVVNTDYIKIKTFGVKAFLIDTTFSRIKIGKNVYFNCLNKRFASVMKIEKPDLQEYTYQLMAKKANKDWKQWIPETNIFWLKYFYKTINSCPVIKKCSDKTPIDILRHLLETIIDCKTLQEFIPNIKEILINHKLIKTNGNLLIQ